VEVAEPELERTARRLRRVRLAFRIALYAFALLLVGVILGALFPRNPALFSGTTSQGGPFQLELDETGDPTMFTAELKTQCPGGDWWVRWYRVGPWQVDDGVITATDVMTRHYDYHDQTGRRTLTLEARVDDDRLRGTATVVEQFDGPRWGRYDCASGAVTFAASQP
jgi:hypothetical protein